MRIAFDGTTLRPRRTGVGYYTEHLLRHLVQQDERHEVVVVSNRPIDLVAPLARPVRTAWGRQIPVRLLWMQLVAPRLLRALEPDVAHFTNSMVPLASDVPTVVTIHDMSLTLVPQFHPVRRLLLNRPLASLAARRVDAVITVSHSARRDILRLYNLPAERVRVVYEAAAPAFRPIRDPARLDEVRRRYALPEQFLLYVGTIEPRKNLARLIEAFAARFCARDVRMPLVCVGRYGWKARDVGARVERLGLRDAVRFLGYVPFTDLPAIYSLCTAFVFPSLHEGFGLPVVEAMACGAPAIVGANSSLLEIADDAALAVDARDTIAIGDALARLVADADLRRDLSRRGRARAAFFSWQRAARETLDVYRWVAEKRGRESLSGDERPADGTRLPTPLTELAARHAAAEQQAPWS